VQTVAISDCCKPFAKFPFSFLMTNDSYVFYIPPPSIFPNNLFPYLNSFIDYFDNFKYPTTPELLHNQYKILTESHSFKGGFLTKQLSGNSGYLRVNCLGASASCIRGTLIVGGDLKPHEVAIPQNLYDSLDLQFNYVLLNRDPSINANSIYVCKLLPYTSKTDQSCIHVNQFVLNGLHADQDGDEVNLYIFYEEHGLSLSFRAAQLEIQRKSWDLGFRHDIFGKCRYSFSKQQQLMLHLYNAELCARSELWADISAIYTSNSEKNFTFWQLSCTTHRDECDDFLSMFLKFCRNTDPGILTVRDLTTADGMLADIVKSGAKGSAVHIEKYIELLSPRTRDEIQNEAHDTFNRYVKASVNMKSCGRQNSISIQTYQNVGTINETLSFNDQVNLRQLLIYI